MMSCIFLIFLGGAPMVVMVKCVRARKVQPPSTHVAATSDAAAATACTLPIPLGHFNDSRRLKSWSTKQTNTQKRRNILSCLSENTYFSLFWLHWWTNTNLNKTLHWSAHDKTHQHTTSCTFQAADPPEARVSESPWIFLVLVVGVLLGGVSRAVADKSPGIQPVVSTDSHRHQGKGRKCPHGGQQHLNAPLTPHHRWAGKETNI